MKFIKKHKLLVILILIAIYFISIPFYKAEAATIASQLTKDTVTSYCTIVPNTCFGQNLGTGLSGDVSLITMSLNTETSSQEYYLKITCFDDSTYTDSPAGQINCAAKGTATSTTSSIETVTTNQTNIGFTVNPTFRFYSDLYYQFFTIKTGSPNSNLRAWGSNSTSTYPNGIMTWNGFDSRLTVLESYFIVTGNIDQNLEFDYPIASSSSIPDFTNWRIARNLNEGDAFKIQIDYGTTTALGYTQSTGWNLCNVDDCEGYSAIPKSNLLIDGQWYAQAQLFVNFGSTSVASTSIIDFVINTSTQEFSGYPYGQGLTQAEQESLCSTSSTGWFDFGAGICQAFTFLFMPNQNTLDQFASLKDEMALKAPFAIFTGVADAWNNVEINATNTPSISIDFSSTGVASGTPFSSVLPNWNAFSSTTIKTYLSDTQIDLFKALITLALWVLYAQSSYYKLLGIFN